mmetsp:Transcript_4686/g.7703  ORF Transcript_4686/g.7703 Transcript_4686/m.7703 type:complete len:99 (-) Transcript_4686:499-795(-)
MSPRLSRSEAAEPSTPAAPNAPIQLGNRGIGLATNHPINALLNTTANRVCIMLNLNSATSPSPPAGTYFQGLDPGGKGRLSAIITTDFIWLVNLTRNL